MQYGVSVALDSFWVALMSQFSHTFVHLHAARAKLCFRYAVENFRALCVLCGEISEQFYKFGYSLKSKSF
jgi:hypothetical protein